MGFIKIIAFAMAFFVLANGSVIAENRIVVKGSTTVLPVAQAAAEAYMKKNPGVNISISGGGSGDGIKALIDRSTDIADSSRDISPEEISRAERNGVDPVGHKVAIDAIVPIVHLSNPVKNLSIEQLSLIYQGKIRNWKEVGGETRVIVVISRDSSSGTYESWGEKVLHGAKVTPRAQLQVSSGMIIQLVSRNKFAIGYIGIGYLNENVKGLAVNGVVATPANALSGMYPIARPLYMYTDGQPQGEAGKFIKFLLSREGQAIVKKEGFVPLR